MCVALHFFKYKTVYKNFWKQFKIFISLKIPLYKLLTARRGVVLILQGWS